MTKIWKQKQKNKWNYISNTKKGSSGGAPLSYEGVLVDNTKQKAEILNKKYPSVFTPENEDEQIPILNDNYPSMQEIYITVNGTEKLLQNLDPTKTTGPDKIPARILKQHAPEFAPHLAYIFNITLTQEEVPTDWHQANVILIFKKVEKYLASNYRHVSLTCICCKLIELIVVSNILNHLDLHNILVDCQQSFRAKRSCETQLLSLSTELLDNLHTGVTTNNDPHRKSTPGHFST